MHIKKTHVFPQEQTYMDKISTELQTNPSFSFFLILQTNNKTHVDARTERLTYSSVVVLGTGAT